MAPCQAHCWPAAVSAAVIRCVVVAMTRCHPNSVYLTFSLSSEAALPMDHKRNLLLAALAVVSYFLLLAWNDDYPTQPVNTPAAASAPVAPSASTATQQGLDLPAASTAVATTDNSNSGTRSAVVPAPTTELISVTTPLQQIKIDPIGGDIVSLSLPKYPISLDASTEGFPLLRNNESNVFVAQSGLVGPNGIDASSKGRPHYSSTQAAYTVDSGEFHVDLTATTDDGVQVIKRFIFNASDYLIRQQIIVNNGSSNEWRGSVFGQIKRDNSKDPSSSTGVRLNNFLGAAMTSANEPYIKIKLADMEKKHEPIDTTGGWVAFSQHYFLAAWIPAANEQNHFTIRKNEKGEYLMGYVGPEHSIASGQSATFDSAIWAGPKNQDRLEEISHNLGLTIDYGMLWFVAYPIFKLLSWIYSLVGNYGIAIVLMTIVIRSLLYPMSAKQFASSAGMKRIQPEIERLKAIHGEDKQKFMQAQLELWKKEGVSPLSGCLPVFIQMPVFLGIYWVLNESVELRQAPFFLWYHDLSAIDSYFLLPLLLGGANFLQQHMNPMPTSDPMQAKMMKFMPAAFTIFFLWLPAGLVLYYFANSLLGIFQQWFFNARLKRVTAKES